ncbi:MAG: TonB-dependent receptor domain-containing protein [Vicinamibacterales bacterium]
MRSRAGVGFVVAFTLLIVSVPVFAQEAALTGTVTDTSGAVLPGVTVRAVHEATGNTFETVTDERGTYRLPVRVGGIVVTMALTGFNVQTRAVELLVGQTAAVNAELSLSTITETVTVTGAAPLLETTTSVLGGNVDPRQVAELPVNGRNYIALALLAPGSRQVPVASSRENSERVLVDRNNNETREFLVNVDGQTITSDFGSGGQPRYSQDSIAEFQYIANRFDATQGRSTGVQVNVITRSGTNRLSGLLRTNFRRSQFNSENRVLGLVEPINNQQYSSAVGGPILRDRIHFFTNYEYEREPKVGIWRTPYPFFNASIEGTNTQKKGGGRLDYQLSPQMRLMGKVSGGRLWEPFGLPSATNHPAATATTAEYNNEYLGQLTRVLSNRALNEIRVGKNEFGYDNRNLTSWSNHWASNRGVTTGSPRITFSGFLITGNQNFPRRSDLDVWSIRDDFTYSFTAKGRHDVRTGGEYLDRGSVGSNCRQCMGLIDARGGPTPSAAQLQAWFPDPFNVDTWNLGALSSITRSYTISTGTYVIPHDTRKFAMWLQDDWQMTDRLTLNVGVRYDVGIGVFANDISFPPFQDAGRPDDWNNVQPRLGFAYRLNDRTVVRGGSGLYYGDALSGDGSASIGNTQIALLRYENDGRPDFAANPTGGRPLPTFDGAQPLYCDTNNAPGCLIRDVREFNAIPEYLELPRTWQTSIGIQRQIGDTTAVEVDYVYSKGSFEKDVIDNINLLFDPATGANRDFRVRSNRPYPDWGAISMNSHTARSSYHGLITSLTKRFSDNWQASATYTLSGFWAAESRPFSGLFLVPFETVPDLGGEWGFSQEDQRHRAVLSGIWQVGRGFQLSGMHYLGAGLREPASYGGDLRNTGATFSGRLRPDGSLVPLNSVIAPAQNRTDVRVQQRIPLPGRLSIDAIAEVFNTFNRPNYDVGTQQNQPSQFLQPINAQYRSAQVGFRLAF